MSGPNGVRDRTGSSGARAGRSDRRRKGAAEVSLDGTREGLKQVKRYLWSRKYTLVYLLILVLLSFAVRSYFYYPAAYTGGPTPVLSGNDPDYHKRTVDYFLNTKHFLQWDPLLNYPAGSPNPNPPAYSTSVALLGLAMAPFYDMSVWDAAWFSMQIGASLWAALTVIPVYLFTKEMFGRKSAYLAAAFVTFMPGNVERTVLGFSDHDAFFMFFIVAGFFFMLKSLRLVKTAKYVDDWRQPRDITVGLTEFVRANRTSLLYASMAGFTMAAVALSWKGFPYMLAIIFVYTIFHLLVNKFRRIDNTAVGMTVMVITSIIMLVSLPYYMEMHFMNWYEAPAILFAATVIVVAIFLFTRDLPWLLILPVLMLFIVVALSAVWYLLPDVWVNIFSGAGYFIRSKLYTTIAEAQAPDFNRLVFAYGMTLFFLGLVGVVLMLKDLPKGWKNDHIFTTIWALVSMYMAIAAIRFMYNATPVFAILSGWLSWMIIKKLDFRRMVRVFRSMKGDFIKALKYSVKLRHVAGVLFVVFLLFAPNVWYSYDGGVPYESKKDHDLAIYYALPSFMRPPEDRFDPDSNSLWYLGSFGTSFMSDYWAQGMWWLAEQDTWLAQEDRPAFISWWDYGHWCVHVGEHPTAADNFQNGVEFAGNFIASQGEEEANALMLVRLFEMNRRNATVQQYMRDQLGDEAVDTLLGLFRNPSQYTTLIHQYPERYGLKDDEINNRNTVYIIGTYEVKQATTDDQRVDMLLWFNNNVGDAFRYFAVDSRLMPVSYQNTGIFYAPIILSDNRVEDFIEIVAIYNGNQITLEQAASLPTDERRNLQYQLLWKRPFFESMFYRCFMGYSGYDQGPEFSDNGIPFVSGDLAQRPPLYGWNQTTWQVVHHTVHWNPYDAANISDHPRDWRAISERDGWHYKETEQGTLDDAIRTISSGVIYLKWYAGAWVNGTLRTESGKPVPGATVTVHDGFRYIADYMGPDFIGVPHGTTTTDGEGRFSMLAPAGNVTVVASNGGNLDYMTLHETNILNVTNLYISDDASMRIGEYNFSVDMRVPAAFQNGTLYGDVNADGIYQPKEDDHLGNASITLEGLGGLNLTLNQTTYPDGYFEFKDMLPGEYTVHVTYKGHEMEDVGLVTLAPDQVKLEDIPIAYGDITGTITRRDGQKVKDTEITTRDLQTNRTWTEKADGTGHYEFSQLFPGNYSVEMYVPGTEPINNSIGLELGESRTMNFTLVPTAFIEGNVTVDDGEEDRGPASPGVANVTLTFQRLFSDNLVLSTRTNETGHYNTSLPAGTWSVYSNEQVDDEFWAFVGTVAIDPEEWSYTADIELRRAYRVNGTLKRHESDTNDTLTPVSTTVVDVWNDGGRVNVMANTSGRFSIHLPDGNYSLFTFTVFNNRTRVNLTRLIVEDQDIDMGEVLLLNGTELQGNVYFDMNGNSAPDAGEGVAGTNVVLIGDGHTFNTTTATDGGYQLNAASLNYTVLIEADAFEPYTNWTDARGNPPAKKNFALRPLNVTYSGLAGFDWDDDGNLSGDGFSLLEITFEATDPENNPNAVSINVTTDLEGRYETSISPGKYRVKVLLDRKEDLGEFRYSYDQILEVRPTTEDKSYNVWLERLVRFNGTMVLSDNETVVSNIRIIVDNGDHHIWVRQGEFDDHIRVGSRLLTASYNRLSTTGDVDYKLEMRHDFDGPTTMNLTLYPIVSFSGVLYFDANGNGRFDPGNESDTDDIGEGVHVPNFVLKGVRETQMYPFLDGTFKQEDLARYDNYTLLVTYDTIEGGVEFQYFKNMTIDLSESTEMNVSLERRIELVGRVFWDKDDDGLPTPGEGILDVNVTFESMNQTLDYTTRTGDDGQYRQYLDIDRFGNGTYRVYAHHPGFTPNRTYWEHTINNTNRTLDMPMSPLNVTFNGTTFYDGNMNGEMNRYERPVAVEHIQLWDVTNTSKTYTTSTDENGSFSFVLPPGTYDLFAWSEVNDGYIVYLGPQEVEPSGIVEEPFIPMNLGRRASGSMWFYNHTGTNHTVSDVNLTFRQLDGPGTVPVLSSAEGNYSIVLPEGRYHVNGSFNTQEFGVEMRYEVDQDFRMVLKDLPENDLNFSKVEEYKLRLWWDEVPIFIDENSSYNLTLYAENTGSMNGTFDLSCNIPPGWLWKTEVSNVSLNMSDRTTFWLLINSSDEAVADPHTITLKAIPRNSTDDPSELEITVNINQYYGFSIHPPEGDNGFYVYRGDADDSSKRRHVVYNFKVTNEGNGREVLIITHTSIQNWTINLKESEVSLEPFEEAKVVPIDVYLPDKETLNPQVLTITATAQNAPENPKKTMDLELSFSDLTISSDDVSGRVDGEEIRWPKEEAPAFGTMAALTALAAAALAGRRRSGRWRS